MPLLEPGGLYFQGGAERSVRKPLTKSQQMALVRARNTSPERRLRSALWQAGLRYRLHAHTPAGRPDLVFAGPKVAVFIDGCFWHGCPEHYSRPRTRPEFWADKLRLNVARDRKQTLELEQRGWIVVRVWEHDVTTRVDLVVSWICVAVRGGGFEDDGNWRVVQVDPTTREHVETRHLEALRNPALSRSETGPRVTGRKPSRESAGTQ